MQVAGIVVAGGTGARLGKQVPKAFVRLAGATLLARATEALRAAGLAPLVAVVPAGWQERARGDLGAGVVVVAGGRSRTASVAAGLAALPDDVEVVAVHDAARPLVPVAVVAETVSALGDDVVAAAPGLPVADTLKRVDHRGVVVGTVARADLVGIQTPQVFHRTALEQAHEQAARTGSSATDDLALVEDLVADGILLGRIVVTRGSPRAMKVTHPGDLPVAEALARLHDHEVMP